AAIYALSLHDALPICALDDASLARPQLELHPDVLPGASLRLARPHRFGILQDDGGELMTHPACDPLDELDHLLNLRTGGDLDIHIRPHVSPPIAVDQRDISIRDVHFLIVEVQQRREAEPHALYAPGLAGDVDHVAHVEQVREDE